MKVFDQLSAQKSFSELRWIAADKLEWRVLRQGKTYYQNYDHKTRQITESDIPAPIEEQNSDKSMPHIPGWEAIQLLACPRTGKRACLAIQVTGLPFLGAQLFVEERGQWRQLTDVPEATFSQPRFEASGSYIYGVWDCNDCAHLYRYNLLKQNWEPLTNDDWEWTPPALNDPHYTYVLAETGDRLWGVAHRHGECALFELDIATAACELVPALKPYTDIKQVRLSPDGRALAMLVASPQTPPTVALYEVDTHKLVMLDPALPVLPGQKFPNPQSMSWFSRDGVPCHGWYYPPELRSEIKPPLLVLIHDGPENCVLKTWPIKARVFTEKGYGVLYVNYRGSTGWGKSFRQSLYGRWGLDDVEDIVAGKRQLAALGLVDGERAGIWGGRFGGATVLRVLQAYPREFQAAVAVYPFIDFDALLYAGAPFRQRHLSKLLGAQDPAQTSPACGTERIKTPLAIFHGAKDPEVSADSIRDFCERLRAGGLEVSCKIYDEMADRFNQKDWLDYYREVMSFWARHLKPNQHVGKVYRDYSHELKLIASPWARWVLLAASTVFLALGIVGIFLPLLPTTPFLLLAAACYARSSGRFYNWLMNHPRMGPTLRQWKETRTIPLRAKILAVTVLLFSLVPSTLLFVPVKAVRIGLFVIAALVATFILRIPTRTPPPTRAPAVKDS